MPGQRQVDFVQVALTPTGCALVRARNAKNPTCGLLIGRLMRKLHFALLSVVFIALAMGVYALQAGAALY
jgi:hypothetical protein